MFWKPGNDHTPSVNTDIIISEALPHCPAQPILPTGHSKALFNPWMPSPPHGSSTLQRRWITALKVNKAERDWAPGSNLSHYLMSAPWESCFVSYFLFFFLFSSIK